MKGENQLPDVGNVLLLINQHTSEEAAQRAIAEVVEQTRQNLLRARAAGNSIVVQSGHKVAEVRGRDGDGRETLDYRIQSYTQTITVSE